MIRRPPRSTLDRSSAASDVYKRQDQATPKKVFEKTYKHFEEAKKKNPNLRLRLKLTFKDAAEKLSLIHISEPTRPY